MSHRQTHGIIFLSIRIIWEKPAWLQKLLEQGKNDRYKSTTNMHLLKLRILYKLCYLIPDISIWGNYNSENISKSTNITQLAYGFLVGQEANSGKQQQIRVFGDSRSYNLGRGLCLRIKVTKYEYKNRDRALQGTAVRVSAFPLLSEQICFHREALRAGLQPTPK